MMRPSDRRRSAVSARASRDGCDRVADERVDIAGAVVAALREEAHDRLERGARTAERRRHGAQHAEARIAHHEPQVDVEYGEALAEKIERRQPRARGGSLRGRVIRRLLNDHDAVDPLPGPPAPRRGAAVRCPHSMGGAR